jgi:hypothetical protein
VKSLLSIGLAMALVLATGAPARADQVYHTERLVLAPVSNAAGSGMVVNIHPNGPKVYAIEQYQLRHAEANTTYQVWLHLYLGASDCSGAPAASLNTAEITTNRAGNGTAQLVLRPADVAGLRGLSFPINWTVTQNGTTTHVTACTIVTLD